MIKRMTSMFLALSVLLSAAAGCGSESYRILKILTIIGSCSVTRSDENIPPYEGMHLSQGDVVDTYAESSLRISLDDDKFILMEPETRIALTASGTSDRNLTSIELQKGAFLNEITAPLAEGSEYIVNTPKAAMAVRGTSFRVVCEQQDSGDVITTVQTFHGSVSVQLYDESDNETDGLTVTENTQTSIITTTAEYDQELSESFFAVPDEEAEGGFSAAEAPEDAITGIDYSALPEETLTELLNTDANGGIKLSDDILSDIESQLGAAPAAAVNETTEPPVTTTAPVTTTTAETTVDISHTSSEVFSKKLTLLTWYEIDEPQKMDQMRRESGELSDAIML